MTRPIDERLRQQQLTVFSAFAGLLTDFRKLWELRIFADDDGMMNRPASEVSGDLLVVSQFTFYADTARAAGGPESTPPAPSTPNPE